METISIKDSGEYLDLVKKYLWLVNEELSIAEGIIEADPQFGSNVVISNIPKLISMVEVVGFLRGQDGAFLTVRPEGVSAHQNELYENERSFEQRLDRIILLALKDENNHSKYEFLVKDSFIQRRFLRYVKQD